MAVGEESSTHAQYTDMVHPKKVVNLVICKN